MKTEKEDKIKEKKPAKVKQKSLYFSNGNSLKINMSGRQRSHKQHPIPKQWEKFYDKPISRTEEHRCPE